jgi:hypothetical protein
MNTAKMQDGHRDGIRQKRKWGGGMKNAEIIVELNGIAERLNVACKILAGGSDGEGVFSAEHFVATSLAHCNYLRATLECEKYAYPGEGENHFGKIRGRRRPGGRKRGAVRHGDGGPYRRVQAGGRYFRRITEGRRISV